MDINVQFSGASQTEVTSYFSCAQDDQVFLNLGIVGSSDPRWKAYYDTLPPVLQEGLPTPK